MHPHAWCACPGTVALTAAFRIAVTRTLRRSDATVSVEGVRYQVPAPWRHLRELHLRVARWDLASVEPVDARCAERLCILYPLDKRANAGALRRRVGPGDNDGDANADGGEHEPAPLLKRILHDQDATGLPHTLPPTAFVIQMPCGSQLPVPAFPGSSTEPVTGTTPFDTPAGPQGKIAKKCLLSVSYCARRSLVREEVM